MATSPFANPESPQNAAALETTQLQLKQALELAKANGGGKDLVPAILVALALNKHALVTKNGLTPKSKAS